MADGGFLKGTFIALATLPNKAWLITHYGMPLRWETVRLCFAGFCCCLPTGCVRRPCDWSHLDFLLLLVPFL